MINTPSSNDIRIEFNGRQIGVAQSYRAALKNASTPRWLLTLSRVCFGSGFGDIDLSGFNVIVVKPDRKIIYSGCEWKKIDLSGDNPLSVAESVEIMAYRRMEIA